MAKIANEAVNFCYKSFNSLRFVSFWSFTHEQKIKIIFSQLHVLPSEEKNVLKNLNLDTLQMLNIIVIMKQHEFIYVGSS